MFLPNDKALTIAIVACCAMMSAPGRVEAQQRQPGQTTGGTQGTGGLGTGTVTNSTGGSGGGTGLGTTNGTTGTVQGVTGRQAGSQSGQGVTQPDFGTFGEAQNQNMSGFIGRGQTGTFIGQQLPGQQNAGQQFGGGNFLGPQFGGVGANQGTTSRGTGQTTTRSRAERLRPQHRVAFSFAPVSSDAVSTRLQTQVRPLRSQGRIRGVQFSLADDGTLTLRGAAASADDRALAAAVARLEPGVRRVDNQIVVPQDAAGPTPPAPNFPSLP